jgi:hypothetical protein
MDVGANQCRIYNTDHTLWKTINLAVPAGNYLYDIKFVSENLFTLDNSLCLAYVYYYYNELNQYYTFQARVIKETGEELISIPGCQYLYLHKLEEPGSKLLAYSYNYSVSPYTIQTHAFSLPGYLTTFPGDANCDGTTNILDVVNIINHIIGQNPVPFCFDNADVNEDGLINILDAVLTVNIIMNKDTELFLKINEDETEPYNSNHEE